MAHIENIVIGKPLVEPMKMFATSFNDWCEVERDITYYTEERFLPKILVECGFYPSLSEIRKNRPDLWISLDKVDFIDKLKVRKKAWVWILVGE